MRDLEAQLQKAEAENEQLSLENKSMANKLRVSSVLGTEAPDADFEAAKALAMKVNELTAALEAANTSLDEARQQAVEARTLADSRQTDLATAETPALSGGRGRLPWRRARKGESSPARF